MQDSDRMAVEQESTHGSTAANPLDLLIIGGGINGVGIARDAAGRGASVMLLEQDDLGKFTSSSSSKLIHGGLRYLENYDFRLVRHSLREREVLLGNAPHIIWPLRFILPHHRSLRPRWLIRLGLFIYDHLAKRKLLPDSGNVDLTQHVGGEPLKAEYRYGFEYSDCWVQDARLVILNAMDARRCGADIRPRNKCIGLERGSRQWTAMVEHQHDGRVYQVHARAVVNAAGPWVEQVSGMDPQSQPAHGIRLVKGSHIIVDKLFDHNYVYIFQNRDGRIMFAIPYEGEFTLLGTTEVEIHGDPGSAQVAEEEIRYICDNASNYFRNPVRPEDVRYSYAGVRPLFDDASKNASKTTRDYVLHLDNAGPEIVSVYGGKITTYRVLAEQVTDMLQQRSNMSSESWTADCSLPGGDIDVEGFGLFAERCKERYGWADSDLIDRLCRSYGTLINEVLNDCNGIGDLGLRLAGNLYEREARYLVNNEWAQTAEDILWRRTKLGMTVSNEDVQRLERWLKNTTV